MITPGSRDLELLRSTKISPPSRQTEALLFCSSAGRTDGHSIGWLPTLAYTQAHEGGRIHVLYRNADLVGFTLHSYQPNAAEVRCLQVWVRRDARQIEHGRALILNLERIAQGLRAWRLRLWCAIDLEANHFWRALGFRAQNWRWSPAGNHRRHVLWTRRVQNEITTSHPPAPSPDGSHDQQQPTHVPPTTPLLLLP